jgi:hypothetical protein
VFWEREMAVAMVTARLNRKAESQKRVNDVRRAGGSLEVGFGLGVLELEVRQKR